MQKINYPKKRLLPQFERHEPAVYDASSLAVYRECARLYFYSIILAFKPKEIPVYFAFGSAYHKFWEELIKSKGNFFHSMQEAQKVWSTSKFTKPELGTPFDFMTSQRLMLTCRATYEYWQKEQAQGKIKVLATEQPLSCVITPSDDYHFQIGGRVDQLVEWSGRLWVRDIKTTSKALNIYERGISPNDQFMRYVYLASQFSKRPVEGVIVLVARNTKKEGPEIHPFVTSRTKWQLDEWLIEQTLTARTLDMNRELDSWPQIGNSQVCGRCIYRSVCNTPNEAGMAAQLTSNFEQRPWDFNKPDAGE